MPSKEVYVQTPGFRSHGETGLFLNVYERTNVFAYSIITQLPKVLFWDGVSHWPRTHQLTSLACLSLPSSGIIRLTIMPSFLYVGSEDSGSPAYKANTVLIISLVILIIWNKNILWKQGDNTDLKVSLFERFTPIRDVWGHRNHFLFS